MSDEEAIKNLEMLKAEIEWDFSLEYQLIIAAAIEKLNKNESNIRNESICETLKNIYKYFENSQIQVYGKDEILDELSQIIDEYLMEQQLKEKLNFGGKE